MTIKNDGFYDAVIKTGIKQYNANSSFREPQYGDAVLTEMYKNALARRIVTAPVDDCVKNWLKIKGDKEEKILQEMEVLGVEKAFVEAGYWDRLYGRSAILIIAKDGKRLDEPLDLKNLQKILRLEVFDKRDIMEDFSGLLINDDPNDENFGKTEYYSLMPPNGSQVMVHHSRLLMFDGEILPRRERLNNQGAGLSVLDGLIKAIRRNDIAQARAIDIVERMSTSMLKLNGLSNLLMSDQGTKAVQERLNMIDMARHLLNTIAIDTEDDFQIYHMNVNGVREIIQEFQQTVSGLSGIPATILFGRSPAGLNSTGAADFENYYNLVRRIQKTKMKPLLERLIKLIQLCKQGPTGGKELEDWQIEFAPLDEMSELEVAQMQGTKQNNDKLLIETLKLLSDMQIVDTSTIKTYLEEKTELPIAQGKLDMTDAPETEEEADLP